MRKVILLGTVLLFFIWILPLGVFIKPSQEKMACNGQRAICLCSHLIAKQAAKDVGKTIYNGSGESPKEQNGSSGSSNPFLSVQKKSQVNRQVSLYHQQQSVLYSLLVVRSIEHVPKV